MKSAAEKLFAFLNCCVCLSRVTNIDLLVFQNVFSISITYPLLNKDMTQSFLSDDKRIPTYLHYIPTNPPPLRSDPRDLWHVRHLIRLSHTGQIPHILAKIPVQGNLTNMSKLCKFILIDYCLQKQFSLDFFWYYGGNSLERWRPFGFIWHQSSFG